VGSSAAARFSSTRASLLYGLTGGSTTWRLFGLALQTSANLRHGPSPWCLFWPRWRSRIRRLCHFTSDPGRPYEARRPAVVAFSFGGLEKQQGFALALRLPGRLVSTALNAQWKVLFTVLANHSA